MTQSQLATLKQMSSDLGYEIVNRNSQSHNEIYVANFWDLEKKIFTIAAVLTDSPQLKWYELDIDQETALRTVANLQATRAETETELLLEPMIVSDEPMVERAA